MKHTAWLAFWVCLLVGIPSTASAKGRADRWQAKEKSARKACITGDVQRGIDILGDLFVETEDITFVFDQGRCYQQNHRWEQAIDRFDEYLRKSPNLSPADRAEVDGHIADCKSHIQPAQPPAPPTIASPAGSPVAAPAPQLPPAGPPESTSVPAGTVALQPPSTSRPGTGMRTAGIAIGAVGLAAVVTGFVLDLKTHSIVSDVHQNGYDPDKLSSRDAYETWGWVSYGVGAAGIVAGATLYLIGASAGRADSPRVSVVPVVGQTGAMLLLQGGIQ